MPETRSSRDPLGLLDPDDPDDWYEGPDRAARKRADRRRARRERRAAKPRLKLRLPTTRPDRARRLVDARWGRALVASVVVLALGTVVGLIALWPTGQHHGPGQAFGGETSGATVVAVREAQCPGPTPQRCRVLGARIDDGPKSGLVTTLELGPTNLVSSLSRGDSIRVHPVAAPPGSRDVAPFQFAGVDRRGTLRWLVILFAALVVILTRWRGVLALGGFALGLFLVVKFLVPAILARLLRCSSLWSARQRSCS